MFKRQIAILTAAAAFVASVETAASAGPISSACLASPRSGKSIALCRCIQQVADHTLSLRDQRTAAKFFNDPSQAQAMRRSNSAAGKKFWERYTLFGDKASRHCR